MSTSPTIAPSASTGQQLAPKLGTQAQPLIIFNDDTCSLRYVDEAHTEEAVSIALRHLTDTQVGAICWCMCVDIAYSWPSKVLDNYYDQLDSGHRIGLYDDTVGFEIQQQRGKPGYYDTLPRGEEPRNVMVSLHRRGIDYLPILIDKARQRGIRFYGSFRMNDVHHRSDPKGMLSSRFWQEHQQYRLWEVTDGRTHYNAALDYSFPEVRQRRLDAVREVTQWYDVDGVELDFCRNPYVFQPSEAWAKRDILTQFIQQVRQELDAAGEKWGRRLDLLIRVPFDDRKLHEAGMDVQAWLDEKLIDTLIMSGQHNDYNQTIEPWVSRCRERGVAYYPCIEQDPQHNAIHNHVTIETVDETVRRQRAAAQNFIAQGASGVYMFNYACLLFQKRRSPEEFAQLSDVFSEIGRQDTLAGKPMQYPYWQNLPIQLESQRPARYHQTIAFTLFNPDLDKEDTRVEISFHQVAEPNPHVDARHYKDPPSVLPPGWVTYLLNGREVPTSWIRRERVGEGRIASGFQLGAHEKVTITPPPSAMKQNGNTLGFHIPRFPEEHDPYINIYELIVDVIPTA